MTGSPYKTDSQMPSHLTNPTASSLYTGTIAGEFEEMTEGAVMLLEPVLINWE